jgi:Flp pilus assembly pilin Flp
MGGDPVFEWCSFQDRLPPLGPFGGLVPRAWIALRICASEGRAALMLATPANMSSVLCPTSQIGLECQGRAGLNAALIATAQPINFCKVSLTQELTSDHLSTEVTRKGRPALIRDTRGVSSVEYSLILAILGTVLAIFAVQFGGAVSTSVNEASVCVATAGRTCN